MLSVQPSISAEKAAIQRPDGVERVMGIEPTTYAWEAQVLPLNYTRCGQG